ncbi:hypothetical protein M0R45_019047 [Rubus argutus]|uniref:Uncharacterized protein n=1 Tax=Rubus argutus TaxID=59490 RepID=A0AAW1X6Z6_RUBAR
MGSSPAPFSDISKKAKDLLTKDYNFDQKFTLSVVGSTGLALTANGLKKDQIFVGDINTLYKSRNVIVDVKVDTYSNVTTKVTKPDLFPNTKVAVSSKFPITNLARMCISLVKLNLEDVCLMLDVQYLHPHAAIDSSIGLNPAPRLELSATIGSKDLSMGGEIGFDTASSLLTKYNAGISFNKPNLSAALLLFSLAAIYDLTSWLCPQLFSVPRQTLKATYIHAVDSSNGTTVAAELTRRFSTLDNSLTLGSAHAIDPYTVVKTRFSDSGKAAILWQREWRPTSLITYDSKARVVQPKRLALPLRASLDMCNYWFDSVLQFGIPLILLHFPPEVKEYHFLAKL